MPKGFNKNKVARKEKSVKKFSNLFENKKRIFKIGTGVQPKRDLTRFVKWPKNILIQRQRRILFKRISVPAMINQFSNTLPSDRSKALFKLLANYKPETKQEKKARLLETAADQAKGNKTDSVKPLFLKSGLNHVTTLVEQGKAKLVVIAHDVDPIELVVWLPSLCVSKNVPFCFIKSKARLGQLVNKKNTTCIAVTDVKKEHLGELNKLAEGFKASYNNNKEMRTKEGRIILGSKANTRDLLRQKAKEAELLQKA